MVWSFMSRLMVQKISLLVILYCLAFTWGKADDNKQVIYGTITNEKDQPIMYAHISVKDNSIGTSTDSEGRYTLKLPAPDTVFIRVSCLGYKDQKFKLSTTPGKRVQVNKTLKSASERLGEVSVKANYDRSTNMIKLTTKEFQSIPSSSGEIENTIKTLPGVSSRNELSSKYSVRGGNYDENLIYVNDVRIYRPFLIRSGKQEGLSFINSDMVSSIKFSAGGFESIYGDKMSSVLDITYKRPEEFGGSVEVSLLGASAYLQGTSTDNTFTHVSSLRYKTNEYLLGTLDTQGEYKPVYGDFQTYLTYRISDKLSFGFLGNYSVNRYNFVPNTRKTVFGTFQDVYNLKIYYNGQEEDRFDNYLGAFTANYHPHEDVSLKFITSAYNSNEQENYDIMGQYLINQVDASVGSENFGDSVMNIGVGTFLRHARNDLNATILSAAHKGNYQLGRHTLQWGIKYKRERIENTIREWEMLDSSGYSLPYSDTAVNLLDTKRAQHTVQSNRLTSYLQNTSHFILGKGELTTIAGIRFHYWDFNQELVVSPRFSVSYTPAWKNQTVFHFSAGYYYQPPFYKEMRTPEGKINHHIRAQKSIHFVLGSQYHFTAWDRAFQFTTDAYYKKLSRVVPYKRRNVQVEYSGANEAKGYATGLDMKVNGEFVEGVESWASLSFMRTRADILSDAYFEEGKRIEPGYYPRPTDQLVNFGLFFQDYFPNHPSYKMSLTLNFGSRLPYTVPDKDRYDLKFRMPSYKRVDIGFSKIFKSDQLQNTPVVKHFDKIQMGAEIFNIFNIRNTISYLWIRTISSNPQVPDKFAIPNYLTGRRFNVKFKFTF